MRLTSSKAFAFMSNLSVVEEYSLHSARKSSRNKLFISRQATNGRSGTHISALSQNNRKFKRNELESGTNFTKYRLSCGKYRISPGLTGLLSVRQGVHGRSGININNSVVGTRRIQITPAIVCNRPVLTDTYNLPDIQIHFGKLFKCRKLHSHHLTLSIHHFTENYKHLIKIYLVKERRI